MKIQITTDRFRPSVNPLPMLINHPEMRRITEKALLNPKEINRGGMFYGVGYKNEFCEDRYEPTVFISREGVDTFAVEKSCRYRNQEDQV